MTWTHIDERTPDHGAICLVSRSEHIGPDHAEVVVAQAICVSSIVLYWFTLSPVPDDAGALAVDVGDDSDVALPPLEWRYWRPALLDEPDLSAKTGNEPF